MFALYQIFRATCHIITKVVETEFVVSTESNIGHISFTTSVRVRLMLIDTIYAQSVEHIKRAHPFRVTLSQIIVDSYHMNTVSCQGIQEYRQGSHQSLTFTSRHFGNLTLMQYDTTKQLYIVVYHVPFHIVTACCPMVFPDSLIAIDRNEIFSFASQLTVEIGSSNYNLIVFRQTACCIFYDSKRCRQHFVQCLFVLVEHFFLKLINLREDSLTLFEFGVFDSSFQLFYLLVFFYSRILDDLLQLLCFGTKFVVA